MSMRTLEENIARLEAATEAAREATREANAAVKDLTRERREIERLLGATAAALVEDRVKDLVTGELDKLAPQMQAFTQRIYERVGQEIDKLIDLTMGEDFATSHGREDVRPGLAAKLREWLREQIDVSPFDGSAPPTAE